MDKIPYSAPEGVVLRKAEHPPAPPKPEPTIEEKTARQHPLKGRSQRYPLEGK